MEGRATQLWCDGYQSNGLLGLLLSSRHVFVVCSNSPCHPGRSKLMYSFEFDVINLNYKAVNSTEPLISTN